MGDLKSATAMYVKAGLFVLAGSIAVGLILWEHSSWRLALLLAIAIWSFCRAYYFAFYVVQHYIDDGYRFAGLMGFLRYLVTTRRFERKEPTAEHDAADADRPRR